MLNLFHTILINLIFPCKFEKVQFYHVKHILCVFLISTLAAPETSGLFAVPLLEKIIDHMEIKRLISYKAKLKHM